MAHDANETDEGEVADESARDRVVWIRTQAFAALLLFVVLWTMISWFHSQGNSDADQHIPMDLVVDLNNATQAELNLLPGVGEKLASDILKYRDEVGGFQSVEELMNIRGIKEGRLLTLRKHITVSGRR